MPDGIADLAHALGINVSEVCRKAILETITTSLKQARKEVEEAELLLKKYQKDPK